MSYTYGDRNSLTQQLMRNQRSEQPHDVLETLANIQHPPPGTGMPTGLTPQPAALGTPQPPTSAMGSSGIGPGGANLPLGGPQAPYGGGQAPNLGVPRPGQLPQGMSPTAAFGGKPPGLQLPGVGGPQQPPMSTLPGAGGIY